MRKRIIAVITAAVLAVGYAGLTGCTKGGRRGATLDVDLSTSYVAEKVTKEGMTYLPAYVTERGVIMTHSRKYNDTDFFLYNLEDGSFTEIVTDQKQYPAWGGTLPDGRLGMVFNDYGHSETSQQSMISMTQDQMIFTDDGTNEAEKTTTATGVLEIYGDDLTIAESIPFGGDYMPESLYGGNFGTDKAGRWYVEGDGSFTVTVLNPDFSVKGTIDTNGMWLVSFTAAPDGKVYTVGHAGGDNSNASQLMRLDGESMTAERLDYAIPPHTNDIFAGPDYLLYYYDDIGIYGVDEALHEKLLMDFRNSDLPDMRIGILALPGGEFLTDYVANNRSIYRFRPRTEEEMNNTKVISLAGVNLSSDLIHDVCDYNREHPELHIVMKDYADPYKRQEDKNAYWEWLEQQMNSTDPYAAYDSAKAAERYPDALKDFQNDLMNGIVPDLISMDGLPYQQLSNKGLLMNLMPQLHADERFHEEDYFMNLLDGMKKGDKLERIGFTFTFASAVGRTEIVGDKQGLTPDEYVAMIDTLPEGMELLPNGGSREDYTHFYLTGSQSAFIDRGAMTCSFDSPAFLSLLKMAGSAKSADEITYSDEELAEQAELGYAYWREHQALRCFTLRSPVYYHAIHRSEFRDEATTIVGYPDTAGGNGGRYRMNYVLSLNSQSARLDEVWEFFMWSLSSIRQSKCGLSSNSDENSLPLHRQMYDYFLDAATRGYHIEGNATTAEMDELRDYANGLRMYAEDDPNISQIITEEAQKYFSGDQSPELAAAMIQSRCSLYLSEQK